MVGLIAVGNSGHAQCRDRRPRCDLRVSAVAREAQPPERSQRQHRGLTRLRDGDASRLRIDRGRDVAVIDFGRAAVTADRLRLALLLDRLLAVERPPLLGIAVLIDHGRVSFNLQGVNAASDLAPNMRVQPDDLGDVGPLELRSQAALRTGGVPLPEQQSRRRVPEQVRRVARPSVGDGPAHLAEPEQRALKQTVPEDRVGQAMGRLQHRDPSEVVQVSLPPEVHEGDREAQLSGLPPIEQSEFGPVGLRSDRVEQHCRDHAVADLPLLNGVLVRARGCVRRGEDLPARPVRGLHLHRRAERDGAAPHRLRQLLNRKFSHAGRLSLVGTPAPY